MKGFVKLIVCLAGAVLATVDSYFIMKSFSEEASPGEMFGLSCSQPRTICQDFMNVTEIHLQKRVGSSWQNFVYLTQSDPTHVKVVTTFDSDGSGGYLGEGSSAYLAVGWRNVTTKTPGKYRCRVLGHTQHDDTIQQVTAPFTVFSQDAALSWPKGEFYLQSTDTGCPALAGVDNWISLPRNHIKMGNTNAVSHKSHFPDDIFTKDRIVEKLCVVNASISKRDTWPAGSYCLGKKEGIDCPAGFGAGLIKMYDFFPFTVDFTPTTSLSAEKYQKTYPGTEENFFHPNFPRLLQFCCRADASSSSSIVLPNAKPFYLYAKGDECQKVDGTTATMEYLTLDTDNYRKSSSFGPVPKYIKLREMLNVGRADNLRIHYCYYVSNEVPINGAVYSHEITLA